MSVVRRTRRSSGDVAFYALVGFVCLVAFLAAALVLGLLAAGVVAAWGWVL